MTNASSLFINLNCLENHSAILLSLARFDISQGKFTRWAYINNILIRLCG